MEIPKKEIVKSPVMHTHDIKSPDVGKEVTDLQTSARTLAEKNRKGTRFGELANRFYPPMK